MKISKKVEFNLDIGEIMIELSEKEIKEIIVDSIKAGVKILACHHWVVYSTAANDHKIACCKAKKIILDCINSELEQIG